MSIFKKESTGTIDLEKVIATVTETPTPKPEPEEEWIWVEGYKGTDKNMQCRGFQFELGTQYDMPEGQEIKACSSGFHLCLRLSDVFGYYKIGDGNRFFKVKALVRKSDKKAYSSNQSWVSFNTMTYTYGAYDNKLASKSIIFLSELTADEILEGREIAKLPEQYKLMALGSSIETATTAYQVATLIEDGYSEAFTHYIANNAKFEVAHALASQKDLSMDVKVLAMFCNK